MDFRRALKEIVKGKNIDLRHENVDKVILVAFSTLARGNADLLQLQELKNILSTGQLLARTLVTAYDESITSGDASFKAVADAIERIADELEKNNISCFSYAYFISCYLDLFAEHFGNEGFKKLGIESIEWIDPEKYDYTYKNMPTEEKTFGFGRYHALIKDFDISGGVLKKYNGRDPYVIVPNFVVGIGRSAFANTKIKSVYIPRSVKSISDGAFSGCKELETVVLGELITELPHSAFEGCELLKRINLDKIVTVGKACFKGCKQLGGVKLSSLVNASDEAFSHCVNIKDFSFVSSLQRIGSRAFEHCSPSFITLERCQRLGDYAFANCATLSRVTVSGKRIRIGRTPFAECRDVTLVNLNGSDYSGYVHELFSDTLDNFNSNMTKLRCIKKDNLKNSEFKDYRALAEVEIARASVIPDSAFEGCSELTAARFKEQIRAIGRSAFSSCSSLSDLEISFIGDEISDNAFYRCAKLKVGNAFHSARRIGDFAFAYTDLSLFDFSARFERIGLFAFANATFPDSITLDLRGCSALPGAFHGAKEVRGLSVSSINSFYHSQLYLLFDRTVEEFAAKRRVKKILVDGAITEGAFAGYSNVNAVEITAVDGKIPSRAFENCSLLESVKVNGTVTAIDPSAFAGCETLSSLDMQYGALTVGSNAFNGCRGVQSLVDLANITRFGEYSFANTDITSLVLSERTQFIGKSAFAECPRIREAVLPFVGCKANAQGDAKYFGAIFGTGTMAYSSEQAVNEGEHSYVFSIPTGIHTLTVLSETLGEDALKNCDFITEVTLPKISALTVSAFDGCTGLRSLALGESLSAFSARALRGCESTVSVSIDSGCMKYKTVSGSVLSRDGETLYFLDHGDGFEHRVEGVSNIASYAVASAPPVLTLPATVKNVDSYALNCAQTKTVTLNSTVGVKPSAFYNCDLIESIVLIGCNPSAAFSSGNREQHLDRLLMSNSGIASISDIFTDVNAISVDSMTLSGVSAESGRFFDKVTSIGDLTIGSRIDISSTPLRGVQVSSISMCSQDWRVSDLLGTGHRLESLRVTGTDVRTAELEGNTYGTVTLEDVRRIREGAFRGCTIDKLVIKSVENIATGAFRSSNIGDIQLDSREYMIVDGVLYHGDVLVYCFDKSMERFTVPSFVRLVRTAAFENLSRLERVTVSHGSLTFEPTAFVGCSRLDTLDIVDIQNRYVRELFDDSTKLRFVNYSAPKVKKKLLSHIDSLLEINLTNVSEVAELAFYANKALKRVTGLHTLTHVGDMAFADCPSLESIELSKNCQRIGVGAFEGCTSLVKASYPIDPHQIEFEISAAELFGDDLNPSLSVEVSARDIPDGYFSGFSATVTVFGSPITVGAEAFHGARIGDISFESTREIGAGAFRGSSLASAEMPRVTSIGDFAFSECASLTSVVLNNGVEHLGDGWLVGSPIASLSGAENGARYRTIDNYLVNLESMAQLVYVAPHSSITSLILDHRIDSISSDAFRGSSVREIDATGVQNIDEGAFAEATSLVRAKLLRLTEGGALVPLSYYFGENRHLQYVEIADGSIADRCFEGFDSLTSVVLPKNVVSLGDRCFEGCRALRSIENLEVARSFGSRIFSGCDALESLTLPFMGIERERLIALSYFFGQSMPKGLKRVKILGGEIPREAFMNFASIENIELPESLSVLPARCFLGCRALKTVRGIDNVRTIGECAFSGCSSLASIEFARATVVGERAFEYCESLDNVNFHLHLSDIGKAIFDECRSLRKLTISFTDSVCDVYSLGRSVIESIYDVTVYTHHLGKRAFAECKNLEYVRLVGDVKVIPTAAFMNCEKLHTFALSLDYLREIHASAFAGCKSLQYFPSLNKVERIENLAFAGAGISGKISLMSLREIGEYAFRASAISEVSSIGSAITRLPRGVFAECQKLTHVSLTNVNSIGNEAFKGCTVLNLSLLSGVREIGEGSFSHSGIVNLSALDVTSIGASAFANCDRLTRIMLNDTLSVIPDRAFSGCTSLADVNVPSALTRIGAYAFEGTSMKKKELRMPPSLDYVDEYAFKDANAPLVYVAAGQEEKWHKNWGDGCKGHGFLFLFHKVKTKKY